MCFDEHHLSGWNAHRPRSSVPFRGTRTSDQHFQIERRAVKRIYREQRTLFFLVGAPTHEAFFFSWAPQPTRPFFSRGRRNPRGLFISRGRRNPRGFFFSPWAPQPTRPFYFSWAPQPTRIFCFSVGAATQEDFF